MRIWVWSSALVVGLSGGVWGLDPVVTNVVAGQVAHSREVLITYDVSDADGDSVDIGVTLSSDGGTTFMVPAVTFSGDVGRVSVGAGKRVLWNAGLDLGEVVGDGYQARVTASDVVMTPGVLTVDLPGGGTMDFIWIAPGTFTMGDANWGPAHEVTLTQGYYLARTELTQGQWQSVMGTTPWVGQSYVQASPSNPAVYVSWDDVQGLVQTLNQAAGESLYRLPSEAEWEYACRAGTTTSWSFGDDGGQLGPYGWYWANAWNVGLTWAQPVGTKLANPWGLYDMHGNVWEWVQDWYGSYSSGAQTDPTGAVTGSDRVVRGGIFGNDAEYTRSAYRFYDTPGYRYGFIGARLLRTR